MTQENGHYPMVSSDVPTHVFEALERAKPLIVERLSSLGVINVEYVVGFVHPYSVSVWLVTQSDSQRDALPKRDPRLDEIREVIDGVGFPTTDASVEGSVAQSQETVDRDYEGSWFYALR